MGQIWIFFETRWGEGRHDTKLLAGEIQHG
jgi:hypothetical protein